MKKNSVEDMERIIISVLYDMSIENGMDFNRYDEQCKHDSIKLNDKKNCTCKRCKKCTAVGICEDCLVEEVKEAKINNDMINSD